MTAVLWVIVAVSVVWAVWELWRQRRRNQQWRRHIDQAIAMTRHPSTPVEDRPDWPPA